MLAVFIAQDDEQMSDFHSYHMQPQTELNVTYSRAGNKGCQSRRYLGAAVGGPPPRVGMSSCPASIRMTVMKGERGNNQRSQHFSRMF